MGSSYRKLKTILESNLLLEKRYLLREQAPSTGATTGNTTTTTTAAPTTTTTTTQKKLTDKEINKLRGCAEFNLPDNATKETIGDYDIYTVDNKGKEAKCKKPIESKV
jgi:hypothetical protein